MINNFIFLNEENIILNNKIYSLFKPLFKINGTTSILVFPKSITLDRSNVDNVDDYLFIEKIIFEYLYFLVQKYNKIDLRDEEKMFSLNIKEDNSSLLVKSRINIFIKQNLSNLLTQHGGNLIIDSVDNINRIILFRLIGSCGNCKLKKNIIMKLYEFVKKEIGNYKLQHVTKTNNN